MKSETKNSFYSLYIKNSYRDWLRHRSGFPPYTLDGPFLQVWERRLNIKLEYSDNRSPTPSSPLSKLISTNGAICGKLNKEAMTKNYVVRALDEGSHLKVPDNKHFSRGNQLLSSIQGEVNAITGAIEKWATSRNKQMAHLRNTWPSTINSPTKWPKHHEYWQINFFAHEENIVHDNDNDPIIISTVIHNFQVDRILVDDGSAVEVLIYETFKNINLDESLLRPTRPIYGFAN